MGREAIEIERIQLQTFGIHVVQYLLQAIQRVMDDEPTAVGLAARIARPSMTIR
jgi:hypothetical protein